MTKHYSVLSAALGLVLAVAPLTFGQEADAPGTVNAGSYDSLQQAIDSAPVGGLVLIPPGRYEIQKPLMIGVSDLALCGAGGSTVIYNASEDGAPAFVIRSGKPNPKRKGRDEALWRIELSGFQLIGNEKSGHGIHAVDINELHLRSLTVTQHGGDGIHMERCFENARVNDCMITYNKATGLNLNVNNHDTVVAANHFEENHDGIRSADGFNLTMTGNNLDDHLGSAVIIEKMMGSVITGNMLEQSQGWGLVLERDTYGTTVASNIFTNNAAGGIELKDAHGCTVTGNTLSRIRRNALVVRAESGRLTVSGNTFTNGFVGDGLVLGNKDEPEHCSGITLENTRGININGNTFTAVRPAALTIAGEVSQCIFSNNLLVDCPAGSAGLKGSQVSGNLEASGD